MCVGFLYEFYDPVKLKKEFVLTFHSLAGIDTQGLDHKYKCLLEKKLTRDNAAFSVATINANLKLVKDNKEIVYENVCGDRCQICPHNSLSMGTLSLSVNHKCSRFFLLL